jgi:hypothetical protein
MCNGSFVLTENHKSLSFSDICKLILQIKVLSKLIFLIPHKIANHMNCSYGIIHSFLDTATHNKQHPFTNAIRTTATNSSVRVSYFTTDGQSVSMSWCRAQSGTFDQRYFIYFFLK